MVYKKINVPLYQQVLHIIISEDVDKEIDLIKKKFDINADRYEFSGYSEAVGQHHLLLLNKKSLFSDEFAISTICHEAFHISNFIIKRIGIIPDVNNDEAQAYLISWIVEQTVKQFKKM